MNLTPERAWEIWWTECIPERSTRELVASYARAIEAEVLRLNGITDKCDGNHGGQRCSDPECWNDDPPVVRVYKSADDLFDSLGIDATPRATGCPDTMDDMGRFAEVEMPAFLRKQAV